MSSAAQTPDDAIRAFFADPAVSKAVVDLVVRKKPIGWGRRSNAPYFKLEHGKELKTTIDDMLRTRQDVIFQYVDFPHIAHNTLYLRINQSLRYVLEFLDTDDRLYARWSEMVNITKEPKGVRISFIEAFRGEQTSSFVPKVVRSKASVPTWKQEVDEYLDDPKQRKPLHRDGLQLSPQEIIDMRASLSQLKNIMSTVTAFEIKIVKTS